MNERSQTRMFADELDCLIERFRNEFDLTYASVIGTLFIKAQELCWDCSGYDESGYEEDHDA